MKKYLDDLGVDLDSAQTKIINPHVDMLTVKVNTLRVTKHLQIANIETLRS